MDRSLRARGRQGFTLLELIIVLAVLAALAALVVPILGWVRDQARFATAAAGAAEVMNNLETYKAATGKYPDRFDSLVSSGTTMYSKLSSSAGGVATVQASGGTGVTAGYYFSNGGGITQVINHDESAVDPNASTDSGTPVAFGAGTNLLFVKPSVTIPDPSDPTFNSVQKVVRIIRTAYPNQGTTTGGVAIPAGHQLIALGIGSRLSAVGTTMTSAPVHGGAAVGKYGRYIGLFDVSPGPTGRGKVQLKMIVDSEFEILAKNVANYQGSAPTDDAGGYVAPPATP